MIGPPLRVSFPKLLGSADRTEEAIAHYRESYFRGGMYDAIVYDGVPAALEALSSAGCRLFVATSKAHHYARPILEHFDLARHFAGIHGPELDGTNDHKGDLIAHIIAQHGVAPETAIMIGDREFDVLAAARNGIRTVGVTWGYGSSAELRRRRCRRAVRRADRLGLDHPGIDGSEGCQRPTISFCRTTRGLPSVISTSTIMRDLPAAWALRRSLRTT